MGYTSEHGFSSSGVDPSWQALLDQLGSQGISQKQIQENEGFIRDFVQGQGGLPVRPLPLSLSPKGSAHPRATRLPPPATAAEEARAPSCADVQAQSASPATSVPSGRSSHIAH